MSTDALIAKYQGLLKDRPYDELLHFSLGKALLDAGRVAEGEVHLRTALDAKPDWMVVTMLLAKIALGRDDTTEARLLYQKGLQLAIDQNHEGPEEEIRAALAKLDP
jgi:Flp pilus assembly protein TadD